MYGGVEWVRQLMKQVSIATGIRMCAMRMRR
nr:MAG TPA: hypothetical protein [Caudoviricetes sp.]